MVVSIFLIKFAILTHFVDPNSDDFTLESINSLGLDAFAETIGQLSLSATKELAIEESLKNIEEQWQGLNLESIHFSFHKHVFL